MARAYCEDVEFSPMDATRSDFEFTAEVVQIAIDAGATVINVPDTVGYTTPEEYAAMWPRLYELVPGLRGVETSVHCHDDLGLAVANSYAGVQAGRAPGRVRDQRARRAGRQLLAGGDRDADPASARTSTASPPPINSREIARTSRMVSRMTGYAVQPNKAIVGRNAFAHESGIHQDGVLKERSTYEIMDATEVGFESNSIVLGKHSGRHALKDALEQLGYKIDGGALNSAFKAFKEIADRKKQVTALDLEAIVSDEMRDRADGHELASFEVSAASGKEPMAKIGVTLPSGEEVVGESSGDGPIDADLPRDPGGDRGRVGAGQVHGRGGDRGRGRPRPDHRDAADQRHPRLRLGRRHRHHRGQRPRLPASAVQRPGRRRDPRGRGSHRRGSASSAPPARNDSTSSAFTPHRLAG